MMLEKFGRLGYVTKGIVYSIIGFLAAQLALGTAGKNKRADSSGALNLIHDQPFGEVLLFLVGIGLIGYVIYRFIQAVYDPEHHEKNWKGYAIRAGYALSAIAYSSLAYSSLHLALTSASRTKGSSSRSSVATLLNEPFGQALLISLGAGVVLYGLFQVKQAYSKKFMEKFKKQNMTPSEIKLTERAGQFGISARGVVFVLIGGFLVQAALSFNAAEAKGFSEALANLLSRPFGEFLLGIIALGLISYAFYLLLSAKFRRIVV